MLTSVVLAASQPVPNIVAVNESLSVVLASIKVTPCVVDAAAAVGRTPIGAVTESSAAVRNWPDVL